MDPSSEHWPVIMLMFLCIVILTEHSVHGPVLRTLAGHNADVPVFLIVILTEYSVHGSVLRTLACHNADVPVYSNTYRVQCTWTRPQNTGRS